MTRAEPGIVTVFIVALVAVIGWELTGLSDPMPVPAVRPRPDNFAASAAEVPDHTRALVATIMARPLFSPDRRPAEDAVGVIADGLPRLTGVLVTPAGRRAIFAVEGRKPFVLTEGGTIAAWTVRAIEAGEVRVSGPDGVRVLHPTFQRQPPGIIPDPVSARRVGQFSSAQ